jgi:type IV pilus biogenesis protein CpaD/CtpE
VVLVEIVVRTFVSLGVVLLLAVACTTRSTDPQHTPTAVDSGETSGWVLVNWDEECMWHPIMGSRNLADAEPALIKGMVERIVDEHAAAGVDSIAHCVLGTGFRSHIPVPGIRIC